MLKRKLSRKHKNSKFTYYASNAIKHLIPNFIYRNSLSTRLHKLSDYDKDYIKLRVNYYNKLREVISLSDDIKALRFFKKGERHSAYYYDSYEFTRYFNPELKAGFKFGDVTYVPNEPSIVKSRPIEGDVSNSIILKLDKIRHFTFVEDNKPFSEKKSMLVGRSHVTQEHRVRFLEMYINHPRCNLGKINNNGKLNHLLRDYLSIEEHLNYKFILCLEGNDVASNLKWVMSSNSLPIMPLPKYETWYMEGTLIPNFHYVQIKDDYSDLIEKMDYYSSHIDEAQAIIDNAHQYVSQFWDNKREDLISLLVLQKYFYKTGQIEVSPELRALFD